MRSKAILVVICVALVGVTVYAVNAVQGGSGQSHANQAEIGASKAVSTLAFTPPAGDAVVGAMVGTPSHGGTWLFDESQSSATLIYVAPPNIEKTRITLGVPSQIGLLYSTRAYMTRSPTGAIWIAANNSIVKVVPSSDQVTVMDVPNPPSNSTAEAHFPPTIQGQHHIVGIAASQTTVMIVLTGTTAVVDLSVLNGTFRQLSLPANDSPVSVALSGTIWAVGLVVWSGATANGPGTGSTDAIDVIGKTHASHVVAGNSLGLSAVQNGFASIGTTSSLTRIKASAANSSVDVSETAGTIEASSGAARPVTIGQLLPIPGSPTDVIAMTESGFLKIDLANGTVLSTIGLPVVANSGTERPPPAPGESPSASASTTMQERPLFASVDGGGNVWFEANLTHTIYEVSGIAT